MTKLNEMKKEDFIKQMKSEFADEVKNSKNADMIIESLYNKLGTYQVVAAKGIIKTQLQSDARLASATTFRGIVVGTRDRKKTKMPMKAVFLSGKQKHFEVTMWGSEVQFIDGTTGKLPSPAIIEAAMIKNERNDWEFEKILAYQKLDDVPKLLAKLDEIKAVVPAKLVRAPVREKYIFPIAAVKGKIIGLRANRINWDDDSAGEYPLLIEDDHKTPEIRPSFTITARDADGTIIYANVDARRFSTGFYKITDLDMYLADAVKEYSTSPKSQAEFVAGALKEANIEVVIIGAVTKKEETDSGIVINISTHAIVEANATINPTELKPQLKLSQEAPKDVEMTKGEEVKTDNEEERNEDVIKEEPKETKETRENGEEEDEEDSNNLINQVEDKFLFLAGVESGKKTREEQTTYLKSQDFEKYMNMRKMVAWTKTTAKKMKIDLDADGAEAVLEQAWSELTA